MVIRETEPIEQYEALSVLFHRRVQIVIVLRRHGYVFPAFHADMSFYSIFIKQRFLPPKRMMNIERIQQWLSNCGKIRPQKAENTHFGQQKKEVPRKFVRHFLWLFHVPASFKRTV